jgi:hypothetical protein
MACSFHGLCGGLSCKELAFEVDVDEAVEFRRVDLEKRLRREDTGVVEAEAGRLLRVLFLRLDTVSADSGRAFGRHRPGFLLCGVTPHGRRYGPKSRDWLRRPCANLLTWWIPKAAILAGLFFPVPVRNRHLDHRAHLMGTACILNAWRCGRTHCRYTGPYYLASDTADKGRDGSDQECTLYE